jgi:hypothetical protein
MRFIPYALYLLLIGVYVVILRDVTSVYAAAINLPALLVLAVGLYKSELAAVWFGFAAGIVLEAGTPALVGWQALSLGALGLAAFHTKERLNLDSLYSKLLLIFCGVLVHNVVSLLMTGSDAFLYRLMITGFAGALYTTAIASIFFLFKEGIITPEKIRSIF